MDMKFMTDILVLNDWELLRIHDVAFSGFPYDRVEKKLFFWLFKKWLARLCQLKTPQATCYSLRMEFINKNSICDFHSCFSEL